MPSQFQITSALPAAPLERSQPLRAPALQSDAGVPLVQALIGAGLVATSLASAVGGLIARAAGWPALWELAPWLGLAWLALWLALATVFWFARLDAAQRTIWSYERLADRDLNGDGQIGRPAPHPFPVGAYQVSADQVEAAWHATAAWFIRECFRTGKRGEKAHVGKVKPDGGRFTQAEYDDLVATLLRARYIVLKAPGRPRLGWIFRPGPTSQQIIDGLARYRST